MEKIKNGLILARQGVSKFASLFSITVIASCFIVALIAWRKAVADGEMPPAGWYESGEMHGPWRHYAEGEFFVNLLYILPFFAACSALFSLAVKPNYRALVCLIISVIVWCVCISKGTWLCG